MSERKKISSRAVFLTVLAVLSIILVSVIVLRTVNRKNKESASEETPAIAVRTMSPVVGPITDYFQINGEIETRDSVEVFADVTGILRNLRVDVGDYVRRGAVIADLDPSSPGRNYELSPVNASIAGTVTALPFDEGSKVLQTSPVATIGDLTKLQVVADIPERFIPKIAVGTTAEIFMEAWPDYTLKLRVDETRPVVDPNTRTMKIKMNIPPDEPNIKSGMYVEIRFAIEKKEQVLKIPSNSVVRRQDEIFVFVVENETAKKRLVVPGISLDGMTEIVSGIDSDDKIIFQGQSLLEEGTRIRIVDTP